MKKALLYLYDFFQGRKILFYSITLAAFVITGILASRITIEEDIARMMPAGGQTGHISEIFSHSRFADKIVVKISVPQDTAPEQLTALADSFEQQMYRGYGAYISEIKTKVSDHAILDIYSSIHDHLPVYLEPQDYKKIDSLIRPDQVHATLESDYKILTSPAGLVLKRMIADDPVGISNIALTKLQALQVNDDYDLYDGYIVTRDKKTLVLFLTSAYPATESSKNGTLVDGIDRVSEELKKSVPGTSIEYFGGIPIAVGNARQSRTDTYVTLSITIVSLLLFIGFFFRRKRVPIVMMLPVIFGVLFALSLIAILQGHISAIAVGAGAVILGIAINYSLHFFSHYKHCGSVRQTISDLLEPMTIGSFTTVGSFFSLLFLQSPILRDFGLFAGLSLTGATIFALLFLPHFIGSGDDGVADVSHESWFDRIPALPAKYNALLVFAIFALTVFFFPYAMRVGFDSDISRLNFMTDKLTHAEKEIESLGGTGVSKTLFIASTGPDLQTALQHNEDLLKKLDAAKAKGYIKRYSSISDFLPSEKIQRQRIVQWNTYWSADKKAQLLSNLRKEGKDLKFNATAFHAFESLLSRDYSAADDSAFSVIKSTFGSEYIIATNDSRAIVNTIKVIDSLRPQLYALVAGPHTVILDKKLIANRLVDVIYRDFNSILLYSSLLVFFALLFSYGRLELTILTFIPMLISWIWILGIMSLFGIRFNILNIILSTFIFGIGDDFSIFITDGLTRRFSEGKETISSHKVSIYLSAGTVLIGLGALIFAKHPAMHSLAVIAIIGICCVVFIGQTVQPFLYQFFIQGRKEKGFAPWTLFKLLLSAFAFTYFVVGCAMLTVVGYFMLLPIPFADRKRKRHFYHILLRALLGSLVYIMANVRKVHINRDLMDFSRPAVIIANHQSFLDILVLAMQHPKLIMFTNSWTYHSPFFGKVIQFADYHPVSASIDDSLDKFRELVSDGYSIAIFPEGTRSPDGVMKRFHKGAYYLAEKLGMDIVPLVLHGLGDTMRKGDFMLLDGQMTMKYLPRIKAGDTTYGTGYAERTKKISRYFKEEYQKLKLQIETPEYYRQRLSLNYIYKGPLLEFYPAIRLRRDHYYTDINSLVPLSGEITILGSGYGFMSYMLHFLGSERRITGIDSNSEMVDIANNCYSKSDSIHFVNEDILACSFSFSDTFVIDSMLHTFDAEAISSLIQRLLASLQHAGTIIIRANGKETNLAPQLSVIAGNLGLAFTSMQESHIYHLKRSTAREL